MRLMALLAVAALTISCNQLETEKMALPPGHLYVDASNAGPGAPFTQIECPDDGASVEADDIQRVAAVCLANDGYLQESIDVINPTNVANAANPESLSVVSVHPTFTAFSGIELTLAGKFAGDVLRVDASGQATMYAEGGGSGSTLWGYVMLEVQDNGGAWIAVPGAIAHINENPTIGDFPYTFSFHVKHVVFADGTTKFRLVGAVQNTADEVRLIAHSIIAQNMNTL